MRRPHRSARQAGSLTCSAWAASHVARDRFGALGAALARRRGGKVAQPGEALQIGGEILGQADRGEIQAFDRDFGAVVGEDAAEQGLARRLVAGDRVLGHRDQLQRHPAAQPQRVERRPPGEAVQAVIEALEQRQAAVVADPDQPLARLDLALARLALHPFEEAHPLSP